MANPAEDAVCERVTVLRAGSEAQIDCGLPGSLMGPCTGWSQRSGRAWLLSHARHMFVRPLVSMDQASWMADHGEASAFFGGAAARLVLGNLTTRVDKIRR